LPTLALLVHGCAGGGGEFVVPPGAGDPLSPARASLASDNPAGAVLKLEEFLRDNPGSALLDEANYLLGRAYLMQKDRVLAADYFQRVLRDFPQSAFAVESAFQLGVAYDGMSRPAPFDQDWTRKAIDAYQSFLDKHPTRPEAEKARQRIEVLAERLARKAYESGELYLKMRAYDSAITYFRWNLERYPEGLWAWRSRLGLAEALLKKRRWSDSLEELERVASECPDSAIREKARKLIRKARNGFVESPPAAPDTAGRADSVATR
jgi:outer membrane protein assembly factor BamD